MESFETKLAHFLEVLGKTDSMFTSDRAIIALKSALIAAKFDQQIGGKGNSGDLVSLTRKKKKPNGYNLYMKEQMMILKQSQPDSNKRMTQISAQWNALSDSDKDVWRQKAAAILTNSDLDLNQASVSASATMVPVKVKRHRAPQKWSGYQVYVSEQMSQVTEGTPKDRMKTIAAQWHALSEDQKAAYKAKAQTRDQPSPDATSVAI